MSITISKEKPLIYLDSAASTKVDVTVIERMNEVQQTFYANPSAGHKLGVKAKELIENARKQCAELLNVDPEEIIFTASGTEANNTVLRAAFQTLKCKHIITSEIEHYSVLKTIKYLKSEYPKVEIDYVNVLPNGSIDTNHLEELLSKYQTETKMVSLMHVNNVIGNINDLEAIGSLCKKYNAYFHSDTVQSIGKYTILPKSSNLDFITSSAHKFNGPKGAGFLYVNKKNSISPLIIGVHQENNLRAGTENLIGIVGMAEAFRLSSINQEKNIKYVSQLKDRLLARLKNSSISIDINGDHLNSSYSTINIAFPQHFSKGSLYSHLTDRNICISGGSACIGASGKQSHVIEALAVNRTKENVRFSFDKYNTLEEVDQVVDVLKRFYLK